MKTSARSLLACILSSAFLLSACSTTNLNDANPTETTVTKHHQTTKAERLRQLEEAQERIDPMVKSKPKKRPADNPKYLDRINKVSRALRNLCVNPKNRAYFEKTPCLPAGMKEVYLQDDSYPTDAQKAVASRLFKEMDSLNDTTRKIMLSSGNPRHVENAKYSARNVQPRIHELQEKFLAGKLTWGDYNRERLAIFNDTADRDTDQ